MATSLLETFANLVLGVVGLWLILVVIFPRSMFDLTDPADAAGSPKTVLSHFLWVASLGYFEDGLGKFWKKLTWAEKRSHAATEHQRYLRGQRMIASMYAGYAIASTWAMAYVINIRYMQWLQWQPLLVLALFAVPIWAWHVVFARQVATWNTDLDASIQVHSPAEMRLFKVRSVLLATINIIFLFA